MRSKLTRNITNPQEPWKTRKTLASLRSGSFFCGGFLIHFFRWIFFNSYGTLYRRLEPFPSQRYQWPFSSLMGFSQGFFSIAPDLGSATWISSCRTHLSLPRLARGNSSSKIIQDAFVILFWTLNQKIECILSFRWLNILLPGEMELTYRAVCDSTDSASGRQALLSPLLQFMCEIFIENFNPTKRSIAFIFIASTFDLISCVMRFGNNLLLAGIEQRRETKIFKFDLKYLILGITALLITFLNIVQSICWLIIKKNFGCNWELNRDTEQIAQCQWRTRTGDDGFRMFEYETVTLLTS